VRRDEKGLFMESDDVGRSLAADRRQHAETKLRRARATGATASSNCSTWRVYVLERDA